MTTRRLPALILLAGLPGLALPVCAATLDAPSGVRFEAAPAPAQGADGETVSVSTDGGLSWSRAVTIRDDIPIRAGRIDPGRSEPEAPEGLRAGPGDRIWIVQYRTMNLAVWRERLAETGAEVLSPLPGHAQIVRMPASLVPAVRLLPFVRWVGPLHPAWRLDPAIVEAWREARLSSPSTRRLYILQTFTPGPGEKSLLGAEVAAAGGRVISAIPNGPMLQAELTLDQAARLARSQHLLWMEPDPGPPGNDMDLVRIQTGANTVESIAGYSGQGVTGEVLDGGIQKSPFHQDHDGVQLHGPPVSIDAHGTSTYGIVFGNGARDGDGNAQATGMLPSGTGWFADYSFLTDRYALTAELVTSPIFASFQSNSWGDATTTAYTTKSFEMDDIIWINDIPIFQSQSNNGSTSSRPQAWAKNVISIGAVDHFNTLTLADDCWCGQASIGPAADGRIKPDLAYWYDQIYTTTTPANGYDSAFGGTSAATPAAAGVSGLILQMWAGNVWGTNPVGTTVFDKRPHAATTKALLINTAEPYPFTGTASDMTRVHQGWGLPSAIRAYNRAPLTKVVNETDVLSDLGHTSWTAAVPAGQTELRVTMTYQDRAGTTLATLHRINDVTLKVTSPGGTVYWGNSGLGAGLWSTPGGAPDTINTVENVFLQNPAAGDWVIEIFADEVAQDVHAETPQPDQDYALVVYPATALTNCTAGVPAPSFTNAAPSSELDHTVQVTWPPAGSPAQYRVYRSAGGCGGPFTLIGTVPGTKTAFLDPAASGGRTYGYVVRAVAGCESPDSPCTQATGPGSCAIAPAFTGASAAASSDTASCGIGVSWAPAAAAGAPVCTGPVVYNVYRSTSPSFTPGPANRVASCLTGTSWTDTAPLVQGTSYSYIVRAEDQGGAGGPCGGVEDANLAVRTEAPFGPATALLAADFESGISGWTAAGGTPAATTGTFIAGDPVGTIAGGGPAQPEDDHTAAGTFCLYTAFNSANNSIDDVDNGEVMVTSPLFSATGFVNGRVRYWRWHFLQDTGVDPGDHYVFEYTRTNGSSWLPLETLDNTVSAPVWTERIFNLPPAQLSAQMRLRVRSADGVNAASIVESAIDDVLVQGNASCTAASGPPGALHNAPLALLAEKAGSSVRLTWGADCGATTKYGVYRGNLLTGWSSVAPVAGMCGLTARTVDLPLDAGSYFYVVAPNDGAAQGSMGLTSSGARRTAPVGACFPTAAALAACAP